MSFSDEYNSFAESLYRTGIISDPWLEGKERFRLEPVILDSETYTRLCSVAESIGEVYEELAELVWKDSGLLEEFFHLTPYQKLMWLSSGGNWHVIARLDLFILNNGQIKMCEMNSDTPSGEAEAVVLNELLHSKYPMFQNPNERFGEYFLNAIFESTRLLSRSKIEKFSIGIIYPTDLTEDLSMITLYRKWFEKNGHEVVTGSPFNLSIDSDKKLKLLGKKIDIMIRHYKTDWWSEREVVWKDDEPFADAEPLSSELVAVIEAEQSGNLTVINPFGAVLSQNKLTMAFCWEHLNKFTEKSQKTIQDVIPETRRFVNALNRLIDEPKENWVIKTDYGCEGDEVILGKDVSEEIWKESLEKVIPNRWIAQKYFDAKPILCISNQGYEMKQIPNYGVYLIGGKATGIFTRVSESATNYISQTAPTFISK